jgi:hypothetical protein
VAKASKRGPREHRQRTTPYRATPELEQLVVADHEVIVTGGAYVVRVVGTVIASANIRDFYAWTDTHPYVYGDSFRTLQAALDNVDKKYRAAFAAKAAATPRATAPSEP